MKLRVKSGGTADLWWWSRGLLGTKEEPLADSGVSSVGASVAWLWKDVPWSKVSALHTWALGWLASAQEAELAPRSWRGRAWHLINFAA